MDPTISTRITTDHTITPNVRPEKALWPPGGGNGLKWPPLVRQASQVEAMVTDTVFPMQKGGGGQYALDASGAFNADFLDPTFDIMRLNLKTIIYK